MIDLSEMEAFRSFIHSIYSTSVRGTEEDKRYWLPCKRKGFTVSAYYHLLIGHNEHSFPWKSIWKQKIPSRVAFFVWTAALGKCLTIDNLKKRKVCILDWCYTCKYNSESVNHLFLHCPLLRRYGIWCLVYLELIGSCLRLLLVSLLAGKVTLVTSAMELFGRLFLLAWCGASGMRGIIDALKTLSVLCPTSSFFFSEPYLNGSLCGETILFLFWIYLTFVIWVSLMSL